MSEQIEVGTESFERVAEVAAFQQRSVREQAEYWIDLSYVLEQVELVDDHGKLRLPPDPVDYDGMEVGELTAAEVEAFFTEHDDFLQKPIYAENYFADRQAKGLGVGALDDGTIVRQVAGGGHAIVG